MTCPRCGSEDGHKLYEEVDIGLGVQTYVYGYDCPECGQVAFCTACGAVDGHEAWCLDAAETVVG